MELFILQELGQGWSLILFTLVSDHSDRGGPLLELCDPILDRDKGHHYQEWTLVALVTN